jgi:cyclopropane-fatty-acyl-phospholipid synthase
MFGGEFVRMWRLYLAGSVASFRAGALQLFQIVFARPNCRRIPWTRAYLYAKEKLIGENTEESLAEREPTWIRVMS